MTRGIRRLPVPSCLAACACFLIACGGLEAGVVTYRYYRFTTVKLRSTRANSVQLSEFELCRGGARTGNPVASNPGGNNPANESPAMAVDGDTATKWLDFNKQALVLDCGAPTPIDGYRWATANDATARDPVRWSVEGSHDNLAWTTVDDRTEADYPTPEARFTFTPVLGLNQVPDTPLITRLTIGDGTIEDATAIAVDAGTPVVLRWEVTGATSVTLDTGGGPEGVAASGTAQHSPAATQAYALAATNDAGTVGATVSAVVGATPLPVVLNEIMAGPTRDGVLLDEDREASDWIELHNPNPFAIHAGGLFLTDDPLQPERWRIPTGTAIGPDGYLLVFASDKDRAVAGGQLHTNFKLSQEGEYLGLVGRDGSGVVDEIAPGYPAQFEDVAYGRVPGGGLGFFVWPTPGAANDTPPGPPGEIVSFTPPAGTFQGEVEVALAVTSPTAVIRFTTDGSLPDEQSPTYGGPLRLTGPTLVRARSYDAGFAPGAVRSEAYLAIDPALAARTSDLPVVLVENFGGGAVPADRELQAAYLTVHQPPAPGGRTDLAAAPAAANRAGIKRRGSSTLYQPKGNYRVEFWQDGSEDDKNVGLLGLAAHDEWVLTAPYNFDRSLVRVSLVHDLSNAIGTYAPRSQFCEVYLNTDGGALEVGDYQGVYVLQERIARDDERVAVERLEAADIAEPAVTGGYILSIDRPDPEDQGFRSALGHPEDPAIADPQPFFNFVYPKEQNILPQQANYIRGYIDGLEAALYGDGFRDPATGYRAWLDVDPTIDHHILNVFAKNPDGLRLSTYLYKPRGGKLAFGPVWDFDRTMGCDDDGRPADPEGWDPPWETAQFFQYDYWGRLFQDPDFWQKWIDRWQSLRDGEFSDASLVARVDGLAARLAEGQPRNVERWPEVAPNGGPLSALVGWEGELDHLRTWLVRRAAWIDTQFTARPALQAGGVVAAGTTVAVAAPAGTVYCTLDGSDPRLPGGGVNPAAFTPDGGGIRIDASATLRARALDGAAWSGIAGETYVVGVAASAAHLVVSEIMYHPTDPTPAEVAAGFATPHDFEFIELQNVAAVPVDLTGVVISAAIDFAFTGAAVTVLGPGEVVVVVRNRAAFEARYGAGLPVAGAWGDPAAADGGPKLDNAGERIVITGLAGTVRDFTYDDGGGWPARADGDGPSLVLADPYALPDHRLASSWRASLAAAGTPGTGHADLYDEWASLHFTPADRADPSISGPAADPDGDRLPNLVELATGGNPRAASPAEQPVAALRTIEVGGLPRDFLTVTFTRLVDPPGATAVAEFSSDLVGWSASGTLVGIVDHGDGTQTVTCRDALPVAGGRRFVRVRADAP